MIRRLTPHDFLLYLRGHAPPLARRFDGISGLSLSGGTLVARVPEGSWAQAELSEKLGGVREAAVHFFGPATSVVLEGSPPDPERLPFPVLASKIWNHVAFWLPGPPVSTVQALRKTVYAECGFPPEDRAEVFRRVYPTPEGDDGPAVVLPDLLDDLCELARSENSYVQLVTPFPGDETADLLEGRLYAVKEWGTPRTPGAILRKYVGRIHYASPVSPLLGIRVLLETPRPPLF